MQFRRGLQQVAEQLFGFLLRIRRKTHLAKTGVVAENFAVSRQTNHTNSAAGEITRDPEAGIEEVQDNDRRPTGAVVLPCLEFGFDCCLRHDYFSSTLI